METLELNKDDSERIVRDYQQKVSSYLGKLIESGQAPWNRQVNGLQDLPYDPSAGKPHRGINRLLLMAKENERGYEYAPGQKDTRWLTADAAAKAYGAELKSDQSGIKVLTLTKLDEDRYRAQTRVLYNAQQFKNFPPMQDMSKSPKPAFSRADELYVKVGIESRENSQPLPVKQLYSWAAQKLDAPQNIPVGSKEYHQTKVGREIFGTLASAEYGVPAPRDESGKNPQLLEAIKRHPDLLFKACLQAENSLDRLIEVRPGMSAGLNSSVAELREPNPYLYQKPTPTQKNEVQSAKKETEVKVDHIEQRVRAQYPVKQYLAVTKDEREEAKKLGAQWDGRGWYANPKAEPRPEVLNHSKFTDLNVNRSKSDIEGGLEAFRAMMAAEKITVEGDLIADGNNHWAAVEDKFGDDRAKGGKYRLAPDKSHGSAINFRTGEVVKWSASFERKLDDKDQAKLVASKAKYMQEKDIQKVILEEKKIDLSQRTHRLLNISQPAPDNHPYLAEKGVKAHGTYVKENKLIIPMHDVQGKIWSYQKIEAEKSPDPNVPRKKYAYGTQPNGLMYIVGGTVKDVMKSGEVMIAEGFATGASVHEATKKPVVVAFSGGNLSNVAEAFRAKDKDMNIFILGEHDFRNLSENLSEERKKQAQKLADNKDRFGSIEKPAMIKGEDIKKMKLDSQELGALRDLNPGRYYAFEAAQKSGGTAIFPKFEKEHLKPGGPSDFNDLHKLKGLGEVKKQVGEALRLAKGPELEQPRKERSVKQELGMSMG